jgi:hypothetical protein
MPNDPRYDAVLSIAKVHLAQAFEAFRTDGFHGVILRVTCRRCGPRCGSMP